MGDQSKPRTMMEEIEEILRRPEDDLPVPLTAQGLFEWSGMQGAIRNMFKKFEEKLDKIVEETCQSDEMDKWFEPIKDLIPASEWSPQEKTEEEVTPVKKSERPLYESRSFTEFMEEEMCPEKAPSPPPIVKAVELPKDEPVQVDNRASSPTKEDVLESRGSGNVADVESDIKESATVSGKAEPEMTLQKEEEVASENGPPKEAVVGDGTKPRMCILPETPSSSDESDDFWPVTRGSSVQKNGKVGAEVALQDMEEVTSPRTQQKGSRISASGPLGTQSPQQMPEETPVAVTNDEEGAQVASVQNQALGVRSNGEKPRRYIIPETSSSGTDQSDYLEVSPEDGELIPHLRRK